MPFAADVAALVTPPHAMVAPAQQTAWTTITVRSGDTLWALAIKHRTTTAAIATKNRLAARLARSSTSARSCSAPAPGKPRSPPAAHPATTPTKPATTPPKKPATGAARPRRALRRDDVGHRQALQGRASRRFSPPTGSAPPATSSSANGSPSPAPARSPSLLRSRRPPSPPRSPRTSKPSTARTAAVAASKARLAAMTVPSRTATADLIRSIATRHGPTPSWPSRSAGSSRAGTSVPSPTPTPSASCRSCRSRAPGPRSSPDARSTSTTCATTSRPGCSCCAPCRNMAESKDQAIAAYYQGLYSVRTRGLYTDTLAYVAERQGDLRPTLNRL